MTDTKTAKSKENKAENTKVHSTVKDRKYSHSNFFNTTKVKEYEQKLKEFEELLKDPKKLFESLGLPVKDIEKLIGQIKSMLNLDFWLDKLGLDEMYKQIMKYIEDALGGFGFTIEQLNKFLDLFSEACNKLSESTSGLSAISVESLRETVVANTLFGFACLGYEGGIEGVKLAIPNISDESLAGAINSFVSRSDSVSKDLLSESATQLGDNVTTYKNSQDKASLLNKVAKYEMDKGNHLKDPVQTYNDVKSSVNAYSGNSDEYVPTDNSYFSKLANIASGDRASGFNQSLKGNPIVDILDFVF